VHIEHRESSLELGEHRDWLKYNKRQLGSEIIKKIDNDVPNEFFWPSLKRQSRILRVDKHRKHEKTFFFKMHCCLQ